MKRLTTDNPKDNIENALNLFYSKDGWTWVRGGGPAPDYADISLCDFVRMLVKANIPDAELPEDNDDLSDLMCDWLIDEPDSAEGIISLLYTAGWAFAELRHRLAAYEDTGLEPEEVERSKLTLMGKSLAEITEFEGVPIERLKQLAEAVKAGRVIAPPCQAGDVLWTYHNWPIERVYSFCVTSVSCLDGVVMIHTDRMGVIPADNVGKTVFLTREEAERALEGGQNNAVT